MHRISDTEKDKKNCKNNIVGWLLLHMTLEMSSMFA